MKDLSSLALRVINDRLEILDQRELPHKEIWIQVINPGHMAELIQSLAVRGAPLIGVSASLALALFSWRATNKAEILNAANILRKARPTAVNLMNNIDSMISRFEKSDFEGSTLLSEAERLFDEDVSLCQQIGDRGSPLINDGDSLITHCNTGGLATVGIGTALGIIRKAAEQGKNIHVYVDETRPLLQGARLTTWELQKLEIPYTLICDNMAGYLMSQRKISAAFIGADRIANNGDVANKIGSYSLAVNSGFHQVPFYVAAPKTTLDLDCKLGSDIPIEQRHGHEILGTTALAATPTWNPAFDIVPKSLISKIILDDRFIE